MLESLLRRNGVGEDADSRLEKGGVKVDDDLFRAAVLRRSYQEGLLAKDHSAAWSAPGFDGLHRPVVWCCETQICCWGLSSRKL